MKKILLIIAIAFLIFQMVVLATAIDIGNAAINRAGELGSYTIVDKQNPANETGTINSVEIWASGVDLSNCEVATFYVVSGNNLSTRDSEVIGSVTQGAKRTFSGLDIDVQAGDYIGLYYTSGNIETDTSGETGTWYGASPGIDYIPCSNQTFNYLAAWGISLYGTGTTEEEGEEANAIFFGTNF